MAQSEHVTSTQCLGHCRKINVLNGSPSFCEKDSGKSSDMQGKFSVRLAGYILIAIGTFLIFIAWMNSYPVAAASPYSYIYDSIPTYYWISLTVANVGLFVVAYRSKNRWERLVCAVLFFVFAYSIKYFYFFIEGPDSDYFLALTQSVFFRGGIPSPQQNTYFEWPMLFILGTIMSEISGLSTRIAAEILFFCWSLEFPAVLFFYSSGTNDIRDFLAVVAYTIVAYPFLNWQYAAQTFALVLFTICILLLLKHSSSSRVLAIVVYIDLLFSHAILPFILVIVAVVMAVRNRKYVTIAAVFGMFYGMYIAYLGTYAAATLVVVARIALLQEYSGIIGATLPQTYFSGIDFVGQIVSRLVTLSMLGLLVILSLLALHLRKLRIMDMALAIAGFIYLVSGSLISILGARSLQIIAIPATRGISVLSVPTRIRKGLLVYFLLMLIIFPVGLVHLIYNSNYYMTAGDLQAANTIINLEERGDIDYSTRILMTTWSYQYIEGLTYARAHYVTEAAPLVYFSGTAWFSYVLWDPQLEKALLGAGLTQGNLSSMEATTDHFDRVYSDGRTTILLNPNATIPPALQQP
jgi:hypothetical protein